MSANIFIQKLFRFKGILRVCGFTFEVRNQTLLIPVTPHKNGRCCPICERKCKLVKSNREERRWRDIPFCGWTVYLCYAPREIDCPTHGRRQESIPWADSHSRVTHRFEWLLLVYCKSMTQKMAAELLRISTSTLSDQLHSIIERTRKSHKIKGLRKIGIDEISYAKGRRFATIVYDLGTSKVLWIGKGKGRKTIDEFFEKVLSDYQKNKITHASCDLGATYIGALKTFCPNAQLVLDRFHIVKLLNDTVDELRKDEWRKLSPDMRKAVRGLRWILYKHPSNRTEEDVTLLKNLKRSNRRLWRAAVLKDEFNLFWDFSNTEQALSFLKKWSTTALKSRIEPLKRFVKLLRKHINDIVSFVDSRLSNAVAEGVNRIIKIVKNRASGFRDLKPFADLIFLVVGDLNIPNKIRRDNNLANLL